MVVEFITWLKVSHVGLSLKICWLSGLKITQRFNRSKPYSSTYFGDGEGCRFLLFDLWHLLAFVIVFRLSLFVVCHLSLFVVSGLLLLFLLLFHYYHYLNSDL